MTQLKLTSPGDEVEIRGTLERVVFHNDDNGYTVFRVRPDGKDEIDLVTATGYMGSPQIGASLLVRGRWVNNPRFGRQLQMSSFESILPATVEGIKLYLSSGLIKGIGKRIAERIVKKFGEDTLRSLMKSRKNYLKFLVFQRQSWNRCWIVGENIRGSARWSSFCSRTASAPLSPCAYTSTTARRLWP